MDNKEEKPITKKRVTGKTADKNFVKGAVAKANFGNTEREKVFIREICVDFNGTRAASVAGYAQPSSRANELLRKPHVIKAIKDYQQQINDNVICTKQMIINELMPIAFADFTNFIEMLQVPDAKGNKTNTLLFKATEKIPAGLGRLIKSMKITQRGIEVTLYDKIQALDMLMQHIDPKQIPTENNAVGIYIPDNNRGDVNVQVNVVNNNS